MQRYTHEVIYKQSYEENAIEYSNNLREWVDNIPLSPAGFRQSFDELFNIKTVTINASKFNIASQDRILLGQLEDGSNYGLGWIDKI